MIKPLRKKSDFIPAPEGLHYSVCCDVVDLGIIKTSWQGQESLKPCVRIYWQTEETMPDGKPYLISKRYTNSSHKKGSLRQHSESWRGKAFTDEEFEDFDLERLIGACCQIQVTHNRQGDDTYANIQAIVPAPKGMPKLPIRSYVRVKDRPGYEAPKPQAGAPSQHGAFPEDVQPTEEQQLDDIPF